MISEWWKRLTSDSTRQESATSEPAQETQSDQADEVAENSFKIPVVRCPTCGGEGATLQSPPTGHHSPAECSFCKGSGLVRAQLVISLVDLPTGRVASRSIVPGVLTPDSDPSGRAALNLTAVVRELAAALDVQSVCGVSSRKVYVWNPDIPSLVNLRYAAEENLSDEWRFEYEGAAIAYAARMRPHQIFYSGVEIEPRASADESFRRLIRMAGQLQLDLIVDVRVEWSGQLIWGVRLDIPGDAVPDTFSGRFNTLHQALLESDVAAAITRLRSSSVTAPARWLETSSDEGRPEDQPEDLSWPELSAKLTPLALRGEGAIGVLRRGEWFLSALERAVDPESDQPRLRPRAAMPEPTGTLIPIVTCPRCRGDPSTNCYRCLAKGTLLDGLALTITDLDGRTKNVNWYPRPTTKVQDEQGARETVSGLPPGRLEILLDRYYSVGDQAKSFDVAPHLLRDHFRNRALDLSLVDGKVSNPSAEPLVAGYLRTAALRRPGGRLIVLARSDPEPPTEALFRSVLGLGLTLGVRVRTARKGRKPPAPGVSAWRMRALPSPDLGPKPRDVVFGSTFASLATAVADFEAEFDTNLRRALAVGSLEPLRVPQQTVPVRVDVEAIDATLDGLSDIFPDTDIWLCIHLNSWTCVIGEPYNRSATAATIQEALAPLVAPDLHQPGPEDLRRLLDIMFDENAGQDQLDAEVGDVQGRYRFGLVLASLLKCLFRERFGMVPEQAELNEYALEAYRDALGEPTVDGETPPDPAVLAELLASIADPTRTAWRRMLLEEHLSAMLQILASLLRDRLDTQAETSVIVDQAVEEGMLMARAVRESVEHREQ